MHLGHSDSIASTDLSDDRAATGELASSERSRTAETAGSSDRTQLSVLSQLVNKESII